MMRNKRALARSLARPLQKDTEISDYAYERTLMMEQRGELFRRLQTNRKQSILLEQEIDGRLISFRIRKPSIYDFDPETIPFSSQDIPMVELGGEPAAAAAAGGETRGGVAVAGGGPQAAGPSQRPDEANVRRMHTALSLNELILGHSKAAKLVIINLPGAPKESAPEAENNCKLRPPACRPELRQGHPLTCPMPIPNPPTTTANVNWRRATTQTWNSSRSSRTSSSASFWCKTAAAR